MGGDRVSHLKERIFDYHAICLINTNANVRLTKRLTKNGEADCSRACFEMILGPRHDVAVPHADNRLITVKAVWRNGSASDYESGGCSFEYYLGHFFAFLLANPLILRYLPFPFFSHVRTLFVAVDSQ